MSKLNNEVMALVKDPVKTEHPEAKQKDEISNKLNLFETKLNELSDIISNNMGVKAVKTQTVAEPVDPATQPNIDTKALIAAINSLSSKITDNLTVSNVNLPNQGVVIPTKPIALSEIQKQVCSKLGIDEEQFLKSLQWKS
jgi:hypothetical protein